MTVYNDVILALFTFILGVLFSPIINDAIDNWRAKYDLKLLYKELPEWDDSEFENPDKAIEIIKKRNYFAQMIIKNREKQRTYYSGQYLLKLEKIHYLIKRLEEAVGKMMNEKDKEAKLFNINRIIKPLYNEITVMLKVEKNE